MVVDQTINNGDRQCKRSPQHSRKTYYSVIKYQIKHKFQKVF